ncbi:MAG: hypothetical protein IPM48_04355 [Saprospiraceae bacterium]|nr:hypothetical protein [Saprospiraceae bacterium]
MSVIRSLAKETLIYGLSYSLGRVINFLLITSYLTYRVFVSEDGYFSIYQELYFYVGLFLGLLTLRMETSYFRFVTDDRYSEIIYPIASRLVWLCSAIFLLIVFLAKNQILAWMKYEDNLDAHLMIASFILVMDVLISLPFAKIRYDKRPLRYAWIKLTGLMINVVLVLIFFEGIPLLNEEFNLHHLSSEQKLFYVLFANLLASLMTLILLYKEISEAFAPVREWSLVKTLIQFAWPLVVVTFSFIIIQSGYTSYLKYLLSDDAKSNLVASDSLNAAFRLAVIMNLFLTAFNYAAEPFFFRQAKKQDGKKHFADLSLAFVFSCCVIYLFTTANLSLVSQLLGPNYRNALHLVPILLMANIFSGMYYNLSAWNKLTDQTLLAAGISFSGLILNTILYFLWLPIYGLDASAWIMCLVYFWMCAWSYFQGQKHYPIPYRLLPMFLSLAFAGGMSWFFLSDYFGNLRMNLLLGNTIALLFVVFSIRWFRRLTQP